MASVKSASVKVSENALVFWAEYNNGRSDSQMQFQSYLVQTTGFTSIPKRQYSMQIVTTVRW
jgi:hypothetical protein